MSSNYRRILVFSVATCVLVLVLAIPFLLPAPSLAKTAVTAPPLAPPPLNPPIQTPEPGTANAPAAAANTDLEVVPFQPSLHIKRGELGALAAGANKPADLPAAAPEKSGSDRAAGPDAPYQSPNLDGVLTTQGWSLELDEGFEGTFPGNWILSDFGNDGFDRTWGDTSYYFQYGSWSVWPAAGGIYTDTDVLDPYTDWYSDNLNSWMEYKFDFSNMDDIFVNFGLWLDTEPEFDWLYFCVSVDFSNYSCDYWSGNTGGWTDQAYWLTSYAGYSEVWIAWVFESDSSVSAGYEGPFVDEVQVWGYSVDATPPPPPTPDPNGELVLNGSFETGDLTNWLWYSDTVGIADSPASLVEERPSLPAQSVAAKPHPAAPDGPSAVTTVGVSDVTAVEGTYAAYLWYDGDENDFLYQTFTLPAGTTDVTINYWFGIGTNETQPGSDWFCASLTEGGTWNFLVDLGCMDVYYATGEWQQVLFTLSDAEVAAIADAVNLGKDIDLNFEMYNRGGAGTDTAAWIDYIRIYATGGGSGLDANESNDDYLNATPISCDTPINGVIGDAFSSYDEDWLVLNNAPTAFDIDIKARTDLNNPSDLDSMLTLYSSPGVTFLDFNDDDGFSYDSFIHYTNTVSANYYIQVESFTGYGGPNHTYELTVDCGGTGQAPPPTDDPNPGGRKWTVMLYLNAEDINFEATLKGYIQNLETFIGSKANFMDILVLYDGPGDGDSARYHIQPNGVYQEGVNYWPRGEVNMGDPDTLASFAGWAMDLFPAENYYLALDDHGHGVYGISWDQTNGNDSLTPPEVYSALKDITNIGQRKIDIFDYEACLMGMAENAYDVSQWVDYVVFFEQISWGLSTYPNYFSGLAQTDTPLAVGQNIVDTYYNLAVAQGYPHTISLIDTSQMAAVKQAATNLGNALVATGNKTAVTTARSNAQAFAASNDATNPVNADYIDLWDLADETSGLVGTTIANQVKTAVTNAVAYEKHDSGNAGGYYWDHSGAHGLSIYYPAFNGSSAFNDYINGRLFQMTDDESGINGRWDEFLVWAVTQGGNGATGTDGGDNRKGMTSVRFLQPKLGGDTFVYLPVVLK